MSKNEKPLGRKAYGSIPHLPTSRLGPGDHHCHEGQAAIALGEKVRSKQDLITVTVKLDGSCCSVAKINGEIASLGRAGYRAETSQYRQHHLFGRWVAENQKRFCCLKEGSRVVGEWLAQAHGTRYKLHHAPFVPFDIMEGDRRLPERAVLEFCHRSGLPAPMPLYRNYGVGVPLETIKRLISTPMHGEQDPVEGAVWRVESKDGFDFLAKWVRPDKIDGSYLPEGNGGVEIWNWRP